MTGTSPGDASRTERWWSRQRATSTYSVKVMRRSSAAHVDVESLVEQAVQWQVPLADILHRRASGAQRELDESEVAVVRGEGVGDAAQVIDGRAAGGGIAHHLPLDRVRAAHVTLLRRGCAVGVPRVLADAHERRRGDQITFVAREI